MGNLFDAYKNHEFEGVSLVSLKVLVDLIPNDHSTEIRVLYKNGDNMPALFAGMAADFKLLPPRVKEVLGSCRVVNIIPDTDVDEQYYAYLRIIVDPDTKIVYGSTIDESEEHSESVPQEEIKDDPKNDPKDDPKEEETPNWYARVTKTIAAAINDHKVSLANSANDYNYAITTGKEVHGIIFNEYIFLDTIVIDSIGNSCMEGFNRDSLLEYMKTCGILYIDSSVNGSYVGPDDKLLYRLDANRLGVDKSIYLNDQPSNQNYGPMNLWHFTRWFVDWAARVKPTAISTNMFSKTFGVGLGKARKVMNHLVSLEIMEEADKACKARTVNIEKVIVYDEYFKRYESCRYCIHYSDKDSMCDVKNANTRFNLTIAESGCKSFFLDEKRVAEYERLYGVSKP